MPGINIDAYWQGERDNQLSSAFRRIEAILWLSSDALLKVKAVMAAEALMYAAEITPWQTGSLATSHRVGIQGENVFVHINPAAVNPTSDEDPPEYGPKVHAMGEQYAGTPLAESPSGGARAFYDQTIVHFGDDIAAAGGDEIMAILEVSL